MIRSLYLTPRFFWELAAVIGVLVVGGFVPGFGLAGQVALGALALALGVDLALLWSGGALKADRQFAPKLSNGDENPVTLDVTSSYRFGVHVLVLDELPPEFYPSTRGARELGFEADLEPGETTRVGYTVRPTERGGYSFGQTNLFAHGPLGLALRRFRGGADVEAKVYPSIMQMERYAFLATSDRLEAVGVKRIRKLGHTMEFDHIREYVRGDDIRTVNWKATARRGGLHVNQYQEERAQPVYALLDMGRTMRSPFHGMTLVDYAVNAALVLLNTALLKGDKAGLVTFDQRVGAVLPASRKPTQLPQILETLYRQRPGFRDPNYEALYATVRRQLRQRGLVLLFTNFESREGLARQLPHLRRIARHHRLVVVFFENIGLGEVLDRPAEHIEDVYVRSAAEGFEMEKRAIVRELERHGIAALLTHPDRLTVDAINKYLQIKAQGSF